MNKRNTHRRHFLGGLAVASLAAASTAQAGKQTTQLTGIYPPDQPAADVGYSPGISVEGRKMVFVSGCGPRDRQADMETQMRQTFEAIRKILEAGGASMKDIANIRAYFVNIERDLPVFRKVRKEFLSKPYPAASAIGVTALSRPDLQIEIEALAVI